MKIEKIIIENVKSFKDRTEIYLNEDMNIFIGPNRGGKSNLLDIIIILLRDFFVPFYRIIPGKKHGKSIEDIQRDHIFSPINISLEKYLGNEQNDSFIEVTFEMSKNDIDNIKFLIENREMLKSIFKNYRNKPISDLNLLDSWDLDNLAERNRITYQIRNGSFINPQDEPSKIYFEYLNYYEIFTFLALKMKNFHLNPLFLYFPPYRIVSQSDFIANLSRDNFYELLIEYSQANSKDARSLAKVTSNYFAYKRRKFELTVKNHKKNFKEDAEVKIVSNFLKQLGYDWEIVCMEDRSNEYSINLKRNGKELPIGKTSSGEKEILNFLLGTFAFNVKDGLIIIDEPDLHLHPTWQNFLIDIFTKLSVQQSNQFLLVTHSPSFINEKTIDNVVRIYLDNNRSKVVQPDKDSLPGSKELLHLINTLNNEKIFFADKVILVEGLSDRILFQALIENYKRNTQEVIEALEVHGKNNFKKFRDFLNLFEIKNYIVADLDYVLNLENAKIKEMFVTNNKKIDKNVIKNKKSKDAKLLSERLKEIIIDIKNKKVNGKMLNKLEKIWESIESRHKKIKDEISKEQETELHKFIESKKSENIYILKYGEIEDYFPELSRNRNIESVIEFIKNKKLDVWVKQKEKDDRKEELESIISDILRIKKRKIKKINSGKKIIKHEASGSQRP